MAGPRPERLEPQPVQQVVDGLEASGHPELLAEDAPHVLAPERAHAVGRSGAGPQPGREAGLLAGVERRLAAAARGVGQAVGAAGVVAGDPGADLPLGEQDLGGGTGGTVPEQGQADRVQAAGDLGAGLRADEAGDFLGGVVRLDVHNGLPAVPTW